MNPQGPEAKALEILRNMLGAVPLTYDPVVLTMPASRVTPAVVAAVKQILPQHPGNHPVQLRILNNGRAVTMLLPMTVSQEARLAVISTLGTNTVTGQ